MSRLTVLTPHGDAVYEVPLGIVGTIGGLELDSDLLSGRGATLCTDPARMASEEYREAHFRQAAPARPSQQSPQPNAGARR